MGTFLIDHTLQNIVIIIIQQILTLILILNFFAVITCKHFLRVSIQCNIEKYVFFSVHFFALNVQCKYMHDTMSVFLFESLV